jgi:hypothetical protein
MHLITPAEYEALTTTYLNYVPLRGKPADPLADPGQERETPPRSTGRGFNVRGDEVKSAKGRYSRAENIIENIIADRMHTIQLAGKNRVLRSFAKFVEDNPSPNLWEMSAEQTKAVFETDPDGNQVIVERTSLDKGEDTIALKDGGVTVYIKIRDQRLLEKFKHMNMEQVNGFTGHLLAANRVLFRLYTSLNPVFVVINGARDVQAATLGMIDEDGFAGSARLLAGLPRAVIEAWRAEVMKRPSVAM